jgi:hypothetical protein
MLLISMCHTTQCTERESMSCKITSAFHVHGNSMRMTWHPEKYCLVETYYTVFLLCNCQLGHIITCALAVCCSKFFSSVWTSSLSFHCAWRCRRYNLLSDGNNKLYWVVPSTPPTINTISKHTPLF